MVTNIFFLCSVSQDPMQCSTVICNSQDSFDRMELDPKVEINQIIPLGESLILKLKQHPCYSKVGRKTNLIIGVSTFLLMQMFMKWLIDHEKINSFQVQLSQLLQGLKWIAK